MGAAIGQSLQMAVGVALSPMPIIAVILLLTTPGARRNGPAFVVGWLCGLAAVGFVVLAIIGPSAQGAQGKPATWVSWLQLTLGTLLLVVSVRQFRGRPTGGTEPPVPGWMRSVERFGPARSLGVGAFLSGLNVKNLLLAIAAATAIARTGVPAGQQAVAYAVFAVIGTLTVAAPVVLYLSMGERSQRLLAALKRWMSRNNAVIMSVLCLLIGAKLVGDAISGLSS
jgi:threonine/homoserine/homoserine lactone efflux protein